MTIRAMSRSFTSRARETTRADTLDITPVRLGSTDWRSHCTVVVTDSRLGRISAFSHSSRESAAETYTDITVF